MSDSLIRLRQINLGDLTGFFTRSLAPILSNTGISLNSGILPTASGTENLGSVSLPFNQIYANQLNIPSGSGLYFGNNFVTAFTSGVTGYIQVGNIVISNYPTGLVLIPGASGSQGLQGNVGATGATGAYVTGTIPVGTTGFRLLFSNGSSGQSINLLSGAIGPTGIGLTGFYQSGNYIFSLFNNGTTGNSLLLNSGQQGQQGKVGGIKFDISDFSGFSGNSITPKAYIYNIDENGFTSNPKIYLIKGMTYDFGYSGLNLTQITITGNGIDYPTGSGIRTNYFSESGITGYLKFCFFDNSVTGLYGNQKTGRYIRQELTGSVVYSDILAKVKDTTVAYNIQEQGTRAETIFTTKLSAGSSYKYGFQKYNFYTQSAIDDLGSWGFYVLGDVDVSYFGRTGSPGSIGQQGIPGTMGERGFKGLDGSQGISVNSVTRSGNSIAFILSDGNTTSYIDLPSGGPSGAQGIGIQGPVGSGSKGDKGDQGATGFADKYASSFYYYDTNINGTGAAFYKRTSGTSTWFLASGTGRRFSAGDEIQFYNDSLVLKAYSTWQKVLFADSPYSRGQYFYATVSSFNPSNGLLSFVVADSPPALGAVSGQILWDSYNLINLNLGGLGSSGAIGISGAVGSQGIKGDTGNPLFVINNPMSGLVKGSNTLAFNQYDFLNLFITGNANIINFDYSTISTGQTLMLRILNSGASDNINTTINPLAIWDANIHWPYSISAPISNPNQSSLFTFLRLPNQNGSPVIMSTYSMGYNI